MCSLQKKLRCFNVPCADLLTLAIGCYDLLVSAVGWLNVSPLTVCGKLNVRPPDIDEIKDPFWRDCNMDFLQFFGRVECVFEATCDDKLIGSYIESLSNWVASNQIASFSMEMRGFSFLLVQWLVKKIKNEKLPPRLFSLDSCLIPSILNLLLLLQDYTSHLLLAMDESPCGELLKVDAVSKAHLHTHRCWFIFLDRVSAQLMQAKEAETGE